MTPSSTAVRHRYIGVPLLVAGLVPGRDFVSWGTPASTIHHHSIDQSLVTAFAPADAPAPAAGVRRLVGVAG